MSDSSDGRTVGLKTAKVLVWLVYAYFLLAVVILVLAFFLLLLNASTAAEFTQWVYRSTDRVLEPFRGIFPSALVGEQGSVVDFAIIFAIVMYGLFALIVANIVDWLNHQIERRRMSLDQERYEAHMAAQLAPGTAPPAAGDPTAN